jgi:hypothetical protein
LLDKRSKPQIKVQWEDSKADRDLEYQGITKRNEKIYKHIEKNLYQIAGSQLNILNYLTTKSDVRI